MQPARRRTKASSRAEDSWVVEKLARNWSIAGRRSDHSIGECTLVISSCPKLMVSCTPFGQGCQGVSALKFGVRRWSHHPASICMLLMLVPGV